MHIVFTVILYLCGLFALFELSLLAILITIDILKLFDNSTVHTKENDNKNQFGYHSNNLTDYCGDFTEEYTDRFDKSQALPKKFRIMTWNIWGMNKRSSNGNRYIFINELMMLRMEEVVKCIVANDPDIIVLQEMSHESLSMIRYFMIKYEISNKYKGYGHNFTEHSPNTMEKTINRDLDNYVFTKYVPDKITQYCLKGNLGYTTGVTCVYFDDICVIGCYLQAGSKQSPGQKDTWHHYSRCRSEQLGAIKNIINTRIGKKSIILCGDFNMNLDGDCNEWPEVKNISELSMQDTWRSCHSDMDYYPGFTEDTSLNHMRWNMKFMEKTYRYDGIFLKNHSNYYVGIGIEFSELIGTQSVPMSDDMFKNFSKFMSNKLSSDKPRSQTYHPSDHFGVLTAFVQND